MSALTNAHNKAGGEPTDSPLCDGLASNALPEAQSIQTGVSVENIQSVTEPSTKASNTPPITMTGSHIGSYSVSHTDVLSRQQLS